ncbi:hypothetical protein [Gemmobacter sp. 24YEA27]|uniref:hypothetical protein n=1 Tax=Gemmobacter sp. 24YEA27 TaxID=3040672 RepID=UPI0024B32383|nr:hypothetical protein [Gemmobacter sp. 24YEA27]
MSSEAFAGKANFLSQAEICAQSRYTREFMSMFDNMEEGAALWAALSCPCVRPLLELQFNGAVNAAVGLVLQAFGYARTDEIYAKFKSKKAKEFKVISICPERHPPATCWHKNVARNTGSWPFMVTPRRKPQSCIPKASNGGALLAMQWPRLRQ